MATRRVYKQELQQKYQQALKRGRVRNSYGRIMFLGPAAVGKTSLRHGLMNQPLPKNADSTILAQTRPVKYLWVKIGSSSHHRWAAFTEEDEIAEEVQLILAQEGENDHSLPESYSLSSESSPESHSPVLSSQCEPLPESNSHQVLSHKEVDKHKEIVLEQAIKQSQLSRVNLVHEVLLHLWDCGGQPVFLDSLPAFMSSRTVFLIVFDASKGLEAPIRLITNFNGHMKDDGILKITTLSLLQKWMASIHARFGSSSQKGTIPGYPKIILVGTHADQLAPGRPHKERKTVAEAILNKLYTSIKGKEYADMVLCGMVIDNTTAGMGFRADSDFEVLRRTVYNFVQDNLSEEMPVSWVHFRKVLQLHTKREKPVISLDEVYSIAAECHVPRDEVPSALLFYHELGVFLFYPNIEGLKSVVILEPQWLVDQFGELFASWKGKADYIDMWNTLTYYGILVKPLYEAVLGNVRKYNLTPSALIEMLEHFLLAVPIVTTHHLHGKVKEYFIPHMLRFHLALTPSHSINSRLMGFFSSLTLHYRSRTQHEKQPQPFKKAAPVHLTFLSGYVPPGYYVRLATSLVSKEGVMVCFDSGIYRDQITMDIGVDRLTITEHTDTVELQFSRQLAADPPFRDSCRRLLKLLRNCFSEVHQWLPGAIEQLAFSCSECANAAQPDVPSRAKFCLFTLDQSASQHLQCQEGHLSVPTHSHKYWLLCNTVQLEQFQFEEDVELVESVPPEVAAALAGRLKIDPLRAIIHQHRRIGGDVTELVGALSDMKLITRQLSVKHSVINSPSTTTAHAAAGPSITSQEIVQETSFSIVVGAPPILTREALPHNKYQLKPLNIPPEMNDLLNKVAAKARDCWEKIALQLKLKHGHIKTIRNSNTQDPILCYSEVFDVWQKSGSPPYTWATIIDALRAPIVGEHQLAHELQEWLTHQ